LELFPYIQGNFLQIGIGGKLAVPGLFGLNRWLVTLPVMVFFGSSTLDRKKGRLAIGERSFPFQGFCYDGWL